MTTTLAPQQPQLDLMTMDEARDCLELIKSCITSAREKLDELDRRQGWRALGFASLRACVKAEFGLSHPTLYKQLAAADVERNLDVRVGTIPERWARELKDLPAEQQRDAYRMATADGVATAATIRAAVREVRGLIPELPGTNGDEPAPPGEISATCSVCHRHFTETLEPGAVASRTCPKCRAKPSRHGITQSEPASHDVMADAPPPTPDALEALAGHSEVTFQPTGILDAYSAPRDGSHRLAHTPVPTPPREGDLAAPPTHGIPASVPVVTVTPPPGADLAHGATDAVSRQAGGLGVDPGDSAAAEYVGAPASDDLDWLHARDITLAQALTLARRLIIACEAKGKPAEWGIGLLERPSVK